MDRYDPISIEQKWREKWEKDKTFRVDIKSAKNPFYNLMMFPYPSGEGLHVGHVYAFGGGDTFGRFMRARGKDVFEPMGFDSFGIHSENYAIKVGKHPRELIKETTTHFRENQLKKLGTLFDWDYQVITSDPKYYKWTQWLFIQLFKAGLAIRKKALVDWCPSCKTVLADEQVIAGKCERCGSRVVQKELEQWFFKITDYAERLLKNLESIDWSETTKQMQRNWIGRSEGVEIEFPIKGYKDSLKVYTTRPDTVYGATFMVVAPEHPLAAKIFRSRNGKEVDNYIRKAAVKTEVERQAEGREKDGVFTDHFAINPFTKKEIPIWIADYVLMGYGTGAIMAVPAHDERDYQFAKKYKLEIVEVISGGKIEKEAFVGEGSVVNSGGFNGLDSKEAINKVSEYIESNQLGKKSVNYHLRDWLISRQRYWGPPIPMIYCQNCAEEGKSWFTTGQVKNSQFEIPNSKSNKKKFESLELKNKNYAQEMRGWYPVPEEDLPVELPHLKDYRPKGSGVSPLADLPDFVNVKCPECGRKATRETDVSDTFLDSAWYFLRYPSVRMKNSKFKIKNGEEIELPWDKEITKKWLPVDMYIGGNEHAVLHLLYTRFITMALNDLGYIDFDEPFKKFRAHGLIIHKGAKMSKSRGNVVKPNDYLDTYGADTLRIYLLFIGPFDLGGDFSDRAIIGAYKFLNRVWHNSLEISNRPANSANKKLAKGINKLIKKVSSDVESLRFNTAIAAMMEFLNLFVREKGGIDIETLKKYIILLAIFAPFTAEELWSRIAKSGSVHDQPWPKVEEETLKEEEFTLVVQVNGRLRDSLRIQNSESRIKNSVEKKARDSIKVDKYLKGKRISKVIYVPGKIINFVTN